MNYEFILLCGMILLTLHPYGTSRQAGLKALLSIAQGFQPLAARQEPCF
jgi:hypothetical protein